MLRTFLAATFIITILEPAWASSSWRRVHEEHLPRGITRARAERILGVLHRKTEERGREIDRRRQRAFARVRAIAAPIHTRMNNILRADPALARTLNAYKAEINALYREPIQDPRAHQRRLAQTSERYRTPVHTLYTRANIDERDFKRRVEGVFAGFRARIVWDEYLIFRVSFDEDEEAPPPEQVRTATAPYSLDGHTFEGSGTHGEFIDAEEGTYSASTQTAVAGNNRNSVFLGQFIHSIDDYRTVMLEADFNNVFIFLDAFATVGFAMSSADVILSAIEVRPDRTDGRVCQSDWEVTSVFTVLVWFASYRKDDGSFGTYCEFHFPAPGAILGVTASIRADSTSVAGGGSSANIQADLKEIRAIFREPINGVH